jgi:ABC-2 type transport system ATP-binding protein
VATEPAIRTTGLTKDYGEGRGVFDLDLAVEAGEIYGYLGPNGAGKTTTIRLLLDLIRPTRGAARLLGLDSRKRSVDVRRLAGYVPGDLALYENLAAGELLGYFARLRGLSRLGDAPQLAERFDLDLQRPIRDLSKGNRQKVGLVQALMHRPSVLILDEPTSGLDPLVQAQVHEVLRESTARGVAVLLSSHVLAEVERIADRVGIIRGGRLILVEQITTLKARALRHLELQFAAPVPLDVFRELPGVRHVAAEGAWVRLEVTGSVDAAVKAAARFEVVDVTSHEPDLEEIFLELYRGEENEGAP